VNVRACSSLWIAGVLQEHTGAASESRWTPIRRRYSLSSRGIRRSPPYAISRVSPACTLTLYAGRRATSPSSTPSTHRLSLSPSPLTPLSPLTLTLYRGAHRKTLLSTVTTVARAPLTGGHPGRRAGYRRTCKLSCTCPTGSACVGTGAHIVTPRPSAACASTPWLTSSPCRWTSGATLAALCPSNRTGVPLSRRRWLRLF